jgi:AcrR family transcriptional regulator
LNEEVKMKRVYRSSRRKAQAEETRSAILAAANSLFSSKGWASTTIAAIAREAEVSGETVYGQFGNKRAILHALVMLAMRGGRPQTPFMEQAERETVLRQSDPRVMLEAFVTDISAVLERVAPVLAVVRAAAESDDEMMNLYRDLHASRLKNLGHFAAALAAIDGLAPGLDEKAATDHIWSLANPELFLVWTKVRGAPIDDYRRWLASALNLVLLPQV